MSARLAAPAGPTWGDLLGEATARLGDRAAARWLLEAASGLSRAELVRDFDAPASALARRHFALLLGRRLAGEPLQHVLGRWPFAGVELIVDRRALVPRPETEVLVEAAVAELDTQPRLGRGRRQLVLDLGTGSGAIACALVAAIAEVEVVALDRSEKALSLASENRSLLAPEPASRLSLRRGSWYEGLDDLRGEVDLVVSNPPYLAAEEWEGLEPVVRDHDPYDALVAGETGLEAIGEVLAGARTVIVPAGSALVEIAPWQAEPALGLAGASGAQEAVVLPDLARRPRVLRARW